MEVDNHVTGLFPVSGRECPLTEVGFEVEWVDYPVSKDGSGMYLWVVV